MGKKEQKSKWTEQRGVPSGAPQRSVIFPLFQNKILNIIKHETIETTRRLAVDARL